LCGCCSNRPGGTIRASQLTSKNKALARGYPVDCLVRVFHHAAISVPVPAGDGGLPAAVQIVGVGLDERDLPRVADIVTRS